MVGVLQPELRPLRIGEILDRAVTLFVRRFAVFVLILAVVAIPVSICQYIAAPQTTAMLTELQGVLTPAPGQPRPSADGIRRLLENNRLGQSGLALVAVSLILSSLSSCACVIAIAQAYAGKLPSVRAVYRAALRRWFAQLVALVIFAAIAFAVVLGLIIVVFLVALAIGALAAVAKLAATIVAIPVAIVAVGALFVVSALIFLTTQLTEVAIALEEPNPIRGIARGLRRTLSPPIFWRSLRVATILCVVFVGGEFVLIVIAAGLSVVTHLTALYPVIAVTGGLVLNALVTTFIVIYSVDIRVRREGYDLGLVAQEPGL